MKKNRIDPATITHFNPNLKEGLTTEQVNERKSELLDNKVKDVTKTQYIDIISS
jgi:hypothetical protein